MSADLRLVFMGTPAFGLASFQAVLEAGFPILAAVTQPDRPRGRGQKITPSPVKAEAQRRGIPILEPREPGQADILEPLRQLQPDLLLVAAFGQFLSRELLAIPRLGSLNVHASLLPRHRGAAPINWAIIRGDQVTGVTIMWVEYKFDTGPIFLQETEPIREDDTAGTLGERLAHKGGRLLVEALRAIARGEIIKRPQPEEGVIWAPALSKEIRRLDFSRPALELHRLIRGLDPKPGAYTFYEDKILKVFKPRLGERTATSLPPGTVLQITDAGAEVVCGDGTLWLQELQLAGGKRQPAATFARGHRLAGVRLG